MPALIFGILFGMRRDVAATDELSDTWQGDVHQITDVDSVEAGQTGRGSVNGKKEFTPSQGPEPKSQRTEQHRKDDEFPAAGSQSLQKVGPAHSTE